MTHEQLKLDIAKAIFEKKGTGYFLELRSNKHKTIREDGCRE